jgi:hypothetical protein
LAFVAVGRERSFTKARQSPAARPLQCWNVITLQSAGLARLVGYSYAAMWSL